MNITLKSLFGILTLAGLFCVPMGFRNSLGLIFLFWPSLLVTLSVMPIFTWRSKSRSIVKSFIFGSFCMLIPSLIWPFGILIYFEVILGYGGIGGNVYLKLAVPLLMASVYGGLIGITLAFGFSKRKQKG